MSAETTPCSERWSGTALGSSSSTRPPARRAARAPAAPGAGDKAEAQDPAHVESDDGVRKTLRSCGRWAYVPHNQADAGSVQRGTMPRAVWVRFVAGLLAVSILLAACGNDDSGGGSTAATGSAAGATNETVSTGRATITMKNFRFHPSTITVSGPTELTLTNEDSVAHTFTLDDLSFTESIPRGDTVTVTVNVPETIGWLCTIHPEMTGTIEVA
jgi:plastocyanin